MARMEKEDRDIVTSVIKDIDSYNSKIIELMGKLKSTVSGMNEYWKDAQYNEFVTYIEELDGSIKQDLAILDESKQDLQRRLAMYN